MDVDAQRAGGAVTVAVGRRFVVMDNVLSRDAFEAWAAEEKSVKHRHSFNSVDPAFDGIAFMATRPSLR